MEIITIIIKIMTRQENINVTKIVKSVYSEFYETCRNGQIDFPEKSKWVSEQAHQHKLNYPELYGYVWDEKNGDWLLEIEHGLDGQLYFDTVHIDNKTILNSYPQSNLK